MDAYTITSSYRCAFSYAYLDIIKHRTHGMSTVYPYSSAMPYSIGPTMATVHPYSTQSHTGTGGIRQDSLVIRDGMLRRWM